MRGIDATLSGTEATEQGRKRSPKIEPVRLRKDVFEALTTKALTRAKQPVNNQNCANLLGLNRFTVRRMLGEDNYEPSVGTALHIANVLGTKVEKLWGPAGEADLPCDAKRGAA